MIDFQSTAATADYYDDVGHHRNYWSMIFVKVFLVGKAVENGGTGSLERNTDSAVGMERSYCRVVIELVSSRYFAACLGRRADW